MRITSWRVKRAASSLPIHSRKSSASFLIRTQAGAAFEFVISRRAPDKPGKGVVFLTPIKGAKQTRAANDAGFSTTSRVNSVRVSGPDRQGLGVKMTRALAEAGINLRGVSGAAIGRKSVAYFAFDSAEDAANAMKVLKKTLK